MNIVYQCKIKNRKRKKTNRDSAGSTDNSPLLQGVGYMTCPQ